MASSTRVFNVFSFTSKTFLYRLNLLSRLYSRVYCKVGSLWGEYRSNRVKLLFIGRGPSITVTV